MKFYTASVSTMVLPNHSRNYDLYHIQWTRLQVQIHGVCLYCVITPGVCQGGALYLSGAARSTGVNWTLARDTCLQNNAALPLKLPATETSCYFNMFQDIPATGIQVFSVWSQDCSRDSTTCGRYLSFPGSPVSGFYDAALDKSTTASFPYVVCREGET